MHTSMDIRDLLITAEESLTEITKAIEALAMDAVYAYIEDGAMQVQFKDESRILASGDAETGDLVLSAPGHNFHFIWDDVAEDWLTTEGGYPLSRVMEKLIAEHSGRKVTLDTE